MPVDSSPFTFLQLSDVHLDSKMAAKRLSMPHSKRHNRTREILDTLVKTLAIARERKVDAVLIPGDLWDSEGVTTATINKVIEAFAELKDIPIVIAPGNHDFYSQDSFYHPLMLEARGMRPLPANVHVFSSPEFTTFKHPNRQDVSFTGRAFTANTQVTQRLLAGSVPKDKAAALNVLVFHGSLEGYKGGDAGWPGKVTAPFSSTEIERLGFDYAALGHYHDLTEIRGADGSLVGAYSGCLAGRSFDEPGRRYVLVGTIASEDGSPTECTIEAVAVDGRELIAVSCDVTGSTGIQVIAKLQAALTAQDAREGEDIVRVRLEGTYPTGGEPNYVVEQLRGLYYHLVVEDETRPDYLAQGYDQRTTEGKFIQALLALKEKAESSGGVTTLPEFAGELSARTIEDALYYGLEALKQQRVTVRDVD